MRELRILWLCLIFALPTANVAQVREPVSALTADPGAVGCGAQDVPCRDWLRFRRLTAGPYQSLAIATHSDSATVIISEPRAPRAEFLALVDAAFGADVRSRTYRRWATGLDGWLEDLVLDVRIGKPAVTPVLSGHDLAAWNAPAPIVDRLLFLYRALHGTSDGFAVDNVNAFPERPIAAAIGEPTVAPADLLDWLTDGNATWIDVTGSPSPLAFKGMEAARLPGVYLRSDRTLVAFAIPPKIPLADLALPFRRFAVASDLLLGGYQSKAGTTWLIGRTRQMPFTHLPPLRFETFASFLRNRTTELVQSYERRRVFAGRVRGGPFAGWDWAPILLSNQLDDSEFGTLLNQADQILKSWSQAGAVDYYAFAHAKPALFPFGRESASEYFMKRIGTTSLVFNWNTQAFTTIHQLDQGELMSIDRFGALPILYLPSGGSEAPQWSGSDAVRRLLDDRRTKAESLSRDAAAAARTYFAERGDPILVRVAQNVLLYQLSQAFLGSVAAPAATSDTARWETVSGILREEAATWLRAVAAPGPTAGMSAKAEAALERAIRSANLTVETFPIILEAIRRTVREWSRSDLLVVLSRRLDAAQLQVVIDQLVK